VWVISVHRSPLFPQVLKLPSGHCHNNLVLKICPYVRTGGDRPLPTRDTYINGQITATLAPEVPKIYPEAFVEPSLPQSLFKHEQGQLFIAHRDHRELLFFTDGACSDNGQTGAQGGCGFVFRCSKGIPRPWNPSKGAYIMYGAFSFRLEDVGPSGKREKPRVTVPNSVLLWLLWDISVPRLPKLGWNSGNLETLLSW
jgi:hypothetical protein